VAWRPSGRETWTSWSTPPSANAASSLTRDRSTVAVPKCVELFGGVADGGVESQPLLRPSRKLVLDHRGDGGSDCPLDLSAHRLEEYVEEVIAVLDAARVRSARIAADEDAKRAMPCVRVTLRVPSSASGAGVPGGMAPAERDHPVDQRRVLGHVDRRAEDALATFEVLRRVHGRQRR